MPVYQFLCPQCQRVTSTINSMRDSHTPPPKCDPENIRTEQKDSDGKPVYETHESCGFVGNESNDPENSIYNGWKKLIGSTSFTINGDSAANSYGLHRRW